MRDLFTDALNRPAGRLAEILMKKIPTKKAGRELTDEMQARFDRLISREGIFGQLARVRMAAEVSMLFERAPKWTTANLVPLFDWSSPDAAAVWSARKYSSYIGSPKLIGLLKTSFLEIFARQDIPDDELRTFSEWLAVMMVATQAKRVIFPISSMEARSALRYAGPRGLSSVAHRLAQEMESAKPDEKVSVWRDVVGPVFQSIWPLDVELQTSEATFHLVQMLRASGAAFPDAAEVIIPFIRAEDPRRHTSIFSISRADDVLYTSSPEKMLDLLSVVVGEAPAKSALGLNQALERLRAHAPQLADEKKFQKLVSAASPY